MILYHYTSNKSFNEITRTGLKASAPWTAKDSAYGPGWYFTDLAPETCDAWTVAFCWRRLDVFTRVESYLKYDIPDEIVTFCREHVYMIKRPDARIRYIDGGPNKKCSTSISCFVCDTFKRVRAWLGLA